MSLQLSQHIDPKKVGVEETRVDFERRRTGRQGLAFPTLAMQQFSSIGLVAS